jgi:CBS-domain-containing membrane protein
MSSKGNPCETKATPETSVWRSRLSLRSELMLVLLPTLVVLMVFYFVDTFSRQRLLFGSLAGSAFLILLEPRHPANSIRTIVVAQCAAAILGFVANRALGPGYAAAAVAMVTTILLMVLLDVMHPPAVPTCLGFSFRSATDSSLGLFVAALLLIVVLVLLQKASQWLLRREDNPGEARSSLESVN